MGLPTVTIPVDCYERMRILAQGHDRLLQAIRVEVQRPRLPKRKLKRRLRVILARADRGYDSWVAQRTRYDDPDWRAPRTR
jgi:hypothetical protein